MRSIVTAILLLGAGATLASAQIVTTNYSLSPHVGIPDGNPVGLTEQFSVSGLNGFVTDVQVSLNILGGFNGDLYAYLAGPQGQLAVLLNRVGVSGSNPFGYGNSGFDITLVGSGGNNIHNYQNFSPVYSGGQLTGTWAADGRNISPLSAGSVFDSASTTANLGVFQNTDANGLWTLFIADLSPGGGTATLNDAMLTIVTVPEPETWAMLGSGLALYCLIKSWRGRGSKS